MHFFKNLIQQRLENLNQNRQRSVDDYIKYLALLAHTGHIDIIYQILFKQDIVFIEKNLKNFLEQPTYQHLTNLFERLKNKNYPVVVYNLAIDNSLVADNAIKACIFEYFNGLKPETANHEQNFVLNFLLNSAIKRQIFDLEMSAQLVEYFIKAKNCNNYRKDFCIFSIVDYCQHSHYLNFFTLQDKFYNHIQKIYFKISNSILLDHEQQREYLRVVSNQIKKVNDVKRDKKQPKIAVCISGLYRNHLISLEKIKENIVLPAQADVFIHSWDKESTWLGFGGSPYFHRVFGKQEPQVTLSEIHDLRNLHKYLPNTAKIMEKPVYKEFKGEIFQEVLKPKKMQIESQLDFEKKLNGAGDYTALRGSLNQIKMFHGIKQSIDMALAYDDYDYIVRLRPDILINKRIDLSTFENLNNNTIYATFDAVGLHDAEFVISSSMAYSLSQLIGEMFKVKKVSPYRSFPLYDSHNLFLLWLIENDYVFDKDLTNKRILTSSDAKAEVPFLKDALDKDFKELNNVQKERFEPFVEFLKNNFC